MSIQESQKEDTPLDNGSADRKHFSRNHWLLMAVLVCGVLILAIVFRESLTQHFRTLYNLVTDRDKVSALISASGIYAPLVFISLQVLQVIFAPVPGEATGFIGGYIFGAGKGFLFSTIGLIHWLPHQLNNRAIPWETVHSTACTCQIPGAFRHFSQAPRRHCHFYIFRPAGVSKRLSLSFFGVE